MRQLPTSTLNAAKATLTTTSTFLKTSTTMSSTTTTTASAARTAGVIQQVESVPGGIVQYGLNGLNIGLA
jgi:hypothetical protein